MRHPFDGIVVPESSDAAPSAQPQRRSFLKILAGAVAGLFGFAASAQAQQQPRKGVLSLALGEAGGSSLSRAFKEDAVDPTKTPTPTLAIGEAGGPVPMTEALNEDGGKVTTFAVGEEGASTRALGEEGGPMTQALRENGGATTKAIGEEGGPMTRALRENGGGRVTTLAVGEEGGPKPMTDAIGEDGGGRATTQALGEEGGRD